MLPQNTRQLLTECLAILFALLHLATQADAQVLSTIGEVANTRSPALGVNGFIQPNSLQTTPSQLLEDAAYLKRQKRFNKALGKYLTVIKQSHDNKEISEALMNAADIFEQMKRSEEAVSLFQQHLARFPAHAARPRTLYRLGILAKEQGDGNATKKYWLEVYKDFHASNEWPETCYVLAKMYHEEDDQHSAHIVTQAWLKQWQGLRSASDEKEKRKLAWHQKFADKVLFLQAKIAVQEQRWLEVTAPLAVLIKKFPASEFRLPAHYWIAEASFRNGQYKKSLAQFKQLNLLVVGRTEPWIPMVLLRKSQLLANQGEWQKAVECAGSIAEMHSPFILQYEADYVIGRCFAGRGEMEDARKAYRKVTASKAAHETETAAMAQWMIGKTYLDQQNYISAVPEFLLAAAKNGFPEWQAKALLQAGVCHERLGQWKNAASLYQLAANHFGKTKVAPLIAKRWQFANKQTLR